MLLICQQKSAEQEPENIFEVVWIEDKKGLQQQKKKSRYLLQPWIYRNTLRA